ncbi:aminopeptidase [Priestia aryabhattai]|uniref:M28 family peptidase n=1 Tax=Bacillaceae TaxID=186817 RepID=UPI000B9FBAFD|nr:M28 family peptidase [Bacillus sp. CBEL-1]OZT14224.1 aminopeptidase [Priestia aryabhattai]TDB54963.1 M28 family peptidase [Bacillus sp. CBEL-1]
MKKTKKTIVSVALATSLALSISSTYTAAAPVAQSSSSQAYNAVDKKVLNKINVDNIYNDIEYLAKTPRVAGTAAEHKAAWYIQKKLKSFGYKANVEPFTFVGYTEASKVELSADGTSYSPSSFTYSVNGNVSAEVVYAGLATKEELATQDLTGKVALIQRGSISFGEKVLNAAEKGAKAVIIYNNADGELNGTLGGANDGYVPAVALSKAEGEQLLEKVKAGTLTATVNIEGAEVSERISYNVTATKSPTEKKRNTDDIIVIGAHHDSVEGAPGANDDASGTAMVIELARVLKSLPTDTELRFVTFGAEELGLIGSQEYVDGLSHDEKDRIVGMFNLDMVGSRDAGDLVLKTADGKANFVTKLAQASSLRLNGAATPYSEGGRSDHVPFAEAGIPAALFIHDPAEPWYHTPEDSIDKISKEKLQDVAEIVGTAVYDRARPDHKGPKAQRGQSFKAPELYYQQDLK